MDPNETFRTFINAMCDDEIEAAQDALIDLEIWIDKGGVAPRFPCNHNVGETSCSGTQVPRMFIKNMINALPVSHR